MASCADVLEYPHTKKTKKKTKHTTTVITISKKPKLNKLQQCTLDKDTKSFFKKTKKKTKNDVKFKHNIEKKSI